MSILDETVKGDSSIATDYTRNPRNLKYDDVFTYEHLIVSAKKCLCGVRWKASTQAFEKRLSFEVYEIYQQLQDRDFKSKGFREFKTHERGKERTILSVHLTERIVQKCLCDFYLVPLITPSLIYDNGACLRGKGITFSLNRIKHHIRSYIATCGTDGYIVLFDVKSFFNSIDKDILLEKLRAKIKDDELYRIYEYFVRQFPQNIGLGLGSQVSQISSLVYLNSLDHRMKDVERKKYYARYMDDGYCIVRTKEEANYVIEVLKDELNKLNLNLNTKKTTIIPLQKEFCFLKRHFKVDGTFLKIRPHRDVVNRFYKKRAKLVKENKKEAISIIDTCFSAYLLEFSPIFQTYKRGGSPTAN